MGWAMRAVLDWLIRRFIVRGTIRVRWPDGVITTYQGAPGPKVAFAIKHWATVRGIVLNPAMAVGEAYMRGEIAAEQGDIYDLLDLLLSNVVADGSTQPILALSLWRDRMLRRIAQWNPAPRAHRNAAHHYDIDGRLYRLFLDADMQYSCAYFPTGTETLDAAQAAKKHHIAAKLLLNRPALKVFGYRLRLGRSGAHLGPRLRRRRHLRHAVAGTIGCGPQPRRCRGVIGSRAL